jgi:DNA-directed RNA polymerase specialized sigma24 family protein
MEAELIRAYLSGATLAEAGARFGLSPASAWRRLRRAGVETRHGCSRPLRKDISREAVLERRARGMTFKAIAAELGCSTTCVRARAAAGAS